MVKPPEQLDLTEKELNAEHTRIMSAKDSGAPHNITRFNYQLQVTRDPKVSVEVVGGAFKLDPSVEQMATHFEMEGNLFHIEDEEGVRILAQKEAAEVGWPPHCPAPGRGKSALPTDWLSCLSAGGSTACCGSRANGRRAWRRRHDPSSKSVQLF